MAIFGKKKKSDNDETEKKKKKVREPKYLNSLLNTKVLNYREYYMSKREKFLYSLVAFAVGAAIAFLMYGGIGSDENGNATAITHIVNIIICTVVGYIAVKLFIPIREKQLQSKRRNLIRRQFMDLLDSLAASVASGNNAVKAFEASQNDLYMQYGADSIIVNELNIILEGQRNFIDIDALLADFGKRSGIKEIESFAQVFALSYRKGGDFGKIIRDSYDILYSKINIEMEIETKIAATKNELNIMLVMPFLMIGIMKMSGGTFAKNFTTPAGILGITAGLAIVVVSYLLGRKITDIEV
ncbi:MAG: type II secretion system F family protein [Ruminococcus sp.]|nr:type II secretion system F family protein [Ruminococcus sp.]